MKAPWMTSPYSWWVSKDCTHYLYSPFAYFHLWDAFREALKIWVPWVPCSSTGAMTTVSGRGWGDQTGFVDPGDTATFLRTAWPHHPKVGWAKLHQESSQRYGWFSENISETTRIHSLNRQMLEDMEVFEGSSSNMVNPWGNLQEGNS